MRALSHGFRAACCEVIRRHQQGRCTLLACVHSMQGANSLKHGTCRSATKRQTGRGRSFRCTRIEGVAGPTKAHIVVQGGLALLMNTPGCAAVHLQYTSCTAVHQEPKLTLRQLLVRPWSFATSVVTRVTLPTYPEEADVQDA